jgi:hypothetical protein
MSSQDSPLGGGPMELAAAIQQAGRAKPQFESRPGAGLNRDGPASSISQFDGNNAPSGQLVNYDYSPSIDQPGVQNPDNSPGNPAPPYHEGAQLLVLVSQEQIGWKWFATATNPDGQPQYNSTPVDSRTGKLLIPTAGANANPNIQFVADLPPGYSG